MSPSFYKHKSSELSSKSGRVSTLPSAKQSHKDKDCEYPRASGGFHSYGKTHELIRLERWKIYLAQDFWHWAHGWYALQLWGSWVSLTERLGRHFWTKQLTFYGVGRKEGNNQGKGSQNPKWSKWVLLGPRPEIPLLPVVPQAGATLLTYDAFGMFKISSRRKGIV